MRRFLCSLLLSLALCPLAAMALEPVNINTADEIALQQINGIGPSKAKAIIDYRNKHGAFAKVDDMIKVPGIGKKSLASMKPQLTAGTATAAPASTAREKGCKAGK
ncbi:MAG: helix-hairpin-helix domain-containing protein [Betaproteobacteria bacterium]|nr:helix-hairpin-helix domain-containing protein [Betaproteobacteria bacterium]